MDGRDNLRDSVDADPLSTLDLTMGPNCRQRSGPFAVCIVEMELDKKVKNFKDKAICTYYMIFSYQQVAARPAKRRAAFGAGSV
jgi:hypothetical protein